MVEPMGARDFLLVTERDYLPVLSQLLEHARESVDLLAFSFAIGSAAGALNRRSAPYQIAERLAAIKARRGKSFRARVLLEGERETEARNRATGAWLTERGVEVGYGATHAKGVCIDGRYLLLGSTNLTDQSIRKNNETNVLLDDPAAAASFLKFYGHRWEGGAHGKLKLAPPLYADGAFLPALLKLIGSAKARIEFSIYFFDQREIEASLVAARARGVEITGFVHQHRAFALPYVRRTRATVSRLRKAGLTGLHYAPPHLFTHSKYLIRDRQELAIGTGNWLDEDVLIHPQLYLFLRNKTLAAELARHLAGQIEAQATGD
jgi:phosphatidylserine/phosphatidylglycerophosphate/cardiolipin synthase-like enzyme